MNEPDRNRILDSPEQDEAANEEPPARLTARLRAGVVAQVDGCLASMIKTLKRVRDDAVAQDARMKNEVRQRPPPRSPAMHAPRAKKGQGDGAPGPVAPPRVGKPKTASELFVLLCVSFLGLMAGTALSFEMLWGNITLRSAEIARLEKKLSNNAKSMAEKDKQLRLQETRLKAAEARAAKAEDLIANGKPPDPAPVEQTVKLSAASAPALSK